MLIDQGGMPLVPENGSVAGIALDLALLLDRGPIVFAGLDGCTVDIRSHARPSQLDPFVVAGTSRFFPGEQARLERVLGATRLKGPAPAPRVSPALGEYAAWFRRRCRQLPGRVYRVRPTAIDYGVPEIDIEAVPGVPEDARQPAVLEGGVGPKGGHPGGINKLVGTLGRFTEEGLIRFLAEEQHRRLGGLPRSDLADLLFVSATRSYANALLEPTTENAGALVSELEKLSRRLARYQEAATG
jgi:hypothetical protein